MCNRLSTPRRSDPPHPDDFMIFHGTCSEKWSEVHLHPKDLYLTDKLSIAKNYADEWLLEGMRPLIVGFRLSDLVKSDVTLEPNWETVCQAEDGLWGNRQFSTWKDTLDANATFCVRGDIEAIKVMAHSVSFGRDFQAIPLKTLGLIKF